MNLKRIVLIIAALSILIYIIYAGVSCIFTTEEDRIRAVIEECREIMESDSPYTISTITDHLTKDFKCSLPVSRTGVPRVIVAAQRHGGKPVIVISGHVIEISGETAKADFRMDVNFKNEGMLKGDHVYQMKTELRKVEGEWKVSSAKWEKTDGPDFSMPW